jgi:hypothetical protein
MSGDRDYPQRNRAAGERDEILGAALRRLEVPAHRPGFHAELRAKLGTAVPEADTAHRERATRPSRIPPRRGQARHPLRWTIGLTAAAAAAAVAVAVAAPGLFTGGPAPASAQSARRILLTAAESAARASVTTGRYWFTDQELGGRYLVKGRGGPYVIEFRKEHRDWTNGHSPNRTHAQTKAGEGGTITHYWADRDLGVHPVGAANIAAWRQGGSPTRWPSLVPGESTKATPWVTKKEQTAFNSAFNEGSLAQINRLPTTPDGLRAFLLRHPDGDQNPRQAWESDQQWLVDAATYLLASEPVPPSVRAAAYRMLAKMPGVRDAGHVTDPLGRPGAGIVMPAAGLWGYGLSAGVRYARPGGPTSLELIIDPATGSLLATENIVAKGHPVTGGLPAGAVSSWMAVKAAAWTSQAPRGAVAPPG